MNITDGTTEISLSSGICAKEIIQSRLNLLTELINEPDPEHDKEHEKRVLHAKEYQMELSKLEQLGLVGQLSYVVPKHVYDKWVSLSESVILLFDGKHCQAAFISNYGKDAILLHLPKFPPKP